MGAIVTKYEVDNSDKDSVGRDIVFRYPDDYNYMHDCNLSYYINDSDDSEFYRLSLDNTVLTVDNGKWKFKSPNYTKEVSEAFKSLIEDIYEKFMIRLPLEIM